MVTERKPVENLSEEDLKQFIRDFVQSRLFTDRHVAEGDAHLLQNIFIPVIFGALDGVTPESLGLIYENIDQAGPRGINGYPCFFSCHLLSRHDWEIAAPIIQKQLKSLEDLEVSQ